MALLEDLDVSAHVVQAHRVDRGDADRPRHGVVVLQRPDPVLQLQIPLDQILAALVIDLPLGVSTSGRFERSISLTPSRASSWCTAWLADDCEIPFSAAPREKLDHRTTSQKIFKDSSCIRFGPRPPGNYRQSDSCPRMLLEFIIINAATNTFRQEGWEEIDQFFWPSLPAI